ncbi:MAG TPA: hypothetical protein VGG74_24050 [Kofleriaceae bacterium]
MRAVTTRSERLEASTSRHLTELITEALRRNDGAPPQSDELGADRATIARAWALSDDPFVMFVLLEAIHQRSEPSCEALARRMSVVLPMGPTLDRQARCRSMSYDGPDPFRFWYFAQRMRGWLLSGDAVARHELEVAVSDVIRAVVADPYALRR